MPTLHFNEHASPACTELGDGTRVYRTCSAGIGCHNLGCGLKVHVRDGRLVKVEGDDEAAAAEAIQKFLSENV